MSNLECGGAPGAPSTAGAVAHHAAPFALRKRLPTDYAAKAFFLYRQLLSEKSELWPMATVIASPQKRIFIVIDFHSSNVTKCIHALPHERTRATVYLFHTNGDEETLGLSKATNA